MLRDSHLLAAGMPRWAVEEAALLRAPDPTTLLAVLLLLDVDHRDSYPTTPVYALRSAASGIDGEAGRRLFLLTALVVACHPRWVSVAGRLAAELERDDLLSADELDELAGWVNGQRILVAALPLTVLGEVHLADDGEGLRAVLDPPVGVEGEDLAGYEPLVLRVDEVELDGDDAPEDPEAADGTEEQEEQEVPVVPAPVEVPMGLHRWAAARSLRRGLATLPALLAACAALPRRERNHVLLGCLDAVEHVRPQDQQLLDVECAAGSKAVRDRWQKVRAPHASPDPTDTGQEALF
ncbi:MAG: hypothetical protein ACTHOD_20575 [Motilibacteraceae bacterium]